MKGTTPGQNKREHSRTEGKAVVNNTLNTLKDNQSEATIYQAAVNRVNEANVNDVSVGVRDIVMDNSFQRLSSSSDEMNSSDEVSEVIFNFLENRTGREAKKKGK